MRRAVVGLMASALSAIVAEATPTLVYPLMDQLPPVARVDSEFIFDLLAGTFTTTTTTATSTGAITYTASSLPSWLTFSPGAQTFYGTPTKDDVGETTISVTATDSTGSVNASWTCLVTDYAEPQVHIGFASQIADSSLRDFASASAAPDNTAITVPPYWSFSLGFDSDTFRTAYSNDNGRLYYEARLRGGTVLPSWLQFSNTTFTFNGVAPANGTYTVVVTGTDFWGYSAALTSFVLEVGEGEAIEVQGKNWTSVDTIARDDIEHVIDTSNVVVGGEPVTSAASEIALTADLTNYPWLSFDSTTNTLSGTTPDTYLNGTISALSVPVSIASTNTSNTLTLTTYLSIDVVAYYFSTFSLPNATVTPSEAYTFDLTPYVTNTSATVNATVAPQDAASWLMFYPANMSLVGTPPSTANYSTVNVTFEAALNGLAARAGLALTLAGINPTTTTSTGSAVPVPTGSTTSTAVHHGLSEGGKIALAAVFGVVGLILLLLLLFCCYRRFRRDKDENDNGDGKDDDEKSWGVPGSPTSPTSLDPFRRSSNPRPNLLGSVAHFSGFGFGLTSSGSNTLDTASTMVQTPRVASFVTDGSIGKATRLDAMKGIFGWPSEKDKGLDASEIDPRFINASGSFIGDGHVIGIADPADHPLDNLSRDGSSFTHTFGSSGSSLASSRASWESRGSFRWSSAENDGSGGVGAGTGAVGGAATAAAAVLASEREHGGYDSDGRRLSTAHSIPRPRPDFIPRYPRTGSPSRLARLASEPSLDHSSFSEFNRDYTRSLNSFAASGSEPSLGTHSGSGGSGAASGTGASGATFYSGPSGLGRYVDSRTMHSGPLGETDDDGSSIEGPGVVALAERQSLETRRPSRTPSARLHSTRQRAVLTVDSSRLNDRRGSSERAIAEEDGLGTFDDADEVRSTYAPSSSGGEVQGLGYPSSAIFFGSDRGVIEEEGEDDDDENEENGQVRNSTIRPVSAINSPMSPPLPSVGSFMRHRRTATATSTSAKSATSATRSLGGGAGALAAFNNPSRPGSSIHVVGASAGGDGRVTACANETFSIHPTIHPPPTVSLSAATWSSSPPSTYRATTDTGAPLPAWLHFDARELELWGVPGLQNADETVIVRIVERMPNANRRSDPMSFGYEPPQDREVGRIVIDVVDRLRSPQFALDDRVHAF